MTNPRRTALGVAYVKILFLATTVLLSLFGCPTAPVRNDAPEAPPARSKYDCDGMSGVHFAKGSDPTDQDQLWVCAWLEGEFECIPWEAFAAALRDRQTTAEPGDSVEL